jgi:predicted ATP-grasp superfamily ATP-dependent carboligase
MSDKCTLLMPTNDRMVKFIIVNYNTLARDFSLSTPSSDTLAICYNKKSTYQRALDLGVPIPESYFPQTFDELLRLSDRLTYPVIIKPAVMHKLYDKEGRKAYVCKSKLELLSNYRNVTKIIDPSEIIVQKLIRGMAKNLYSYCSFFADGEMHGGFVANRIRQRPMDFGVSTTYAIAVSNQEIEDNAIRFLKGIGYFGLSEVEFMYDPDDSTFKLIEVNPRTWKWHTISNKLNVNFIRIMTSYLDGSEFKSQGGGDAKVGWIETITDTYVVLGEILRGRMNFSQYFRSLKMVKEFACFDWRDPLPALGYVALLPYLMFSR